MGEGKPQLKVASFGRRYEVFADGVKVAHCPNRKPLAALLLHHNRSSDTWSIEHRFGKLDLVGKNQSQGKLMQPGYYLVEI